MTSNELLAILEKEKIPSCYYKIYDIGGPEFDVVCHLERAKQKFCLRITERGENVYNQYFGTENEACKQFLIEMSIGYPNLKKYII